jgi:hypothetical protein
MPAAAPPGHPTPTCHQEQYDVSTKYGLVGTAPLPALHYPTPVLLWLLQTNRSLGAIVKMEQEFRDEPA